MDQASGRRDIEVEEVRERHRSQRHQDTFDLATAEQQIASRFILGQAAIYRMGSFGE